MVLGWVVSLLAVVLTGYLVFASADRPLVFHGAFVLSIAAFVVCSLWLLSRGLAAISSRDQQRQRDHRDRP